MLYPDFYKRFANIQKQMKAPIFMTEGWRSIETQQEYYALGREVPGQKITNAKPYQSLHHYGLAVDIAFMAEDPWSESHPWDELGRIVVENGCQWGGNWDRFRDRPHIYKDYGLTWEQLAKVYKKYDLQEVWKFVDESKKKLKEEEL